MIPDLAREKAFWRNAFGIPESYAITMVYADDVRHPETGQPAYGLCNRRPDGADIIIRRPRTVADLAEVHETIAHEMLHCLFPNDGITEEQEEGIVWKVAPLLADLRTQQPQRARVLARAMARSEKVLLVHRARAEGKVMDPKVLAALAAKLLEMANLPEEAKAIVQEILTAAATPADAPPGESEPPMAQDRPPADAAKPPGEAPMGMTEDPEKRYRKLAEDQASDRAAAVERVLKTRPDLTEKQRARLREIGIEKGLARLDADLDELVPPPAKQPEQTPEARARMGVDRPPQGGAGGGSAKPSADKTLNARFRIFEDSESNGVTVLDARTTGKLVELDHFAAFPMIRKASSDLVAAQRAKALGARK